MSDHLVLSLPDAKRTASCGSSLASSLYAIPLDIHLSGPLGSGKTTFVQGFAGGLGVTDPVTSPTYALQQQYRTLRWGTLTHVDLYRLSPEETRDILRASEHHGGIRCIEWADRAQQNRTDRSTQPPPGIHLTFSEPESSGRLLTAVFDDLLLPERSEVESWRREVLLPEHIAAHCDAVAACAGRLAEALRKRCVIVRPLALQRAAEAHDLLRFLDFRPGGHAGSAPSPHASEHWERMRVRYRGLRHEAACAAWLRERGYGGLAEIVAVHGLTLPSPERRTIEQQLLFYADKRVALDRVVTLEERFADFQSRYSGGRPTEEGETWHAEALAVERALFPDGPPF